MSAAEEPNIMKSILLAAASVLTLGLATTGANAQTNPCDDGEIVIKFSHVVAATGHPVTTTNNERNPRNGGLIHCH